MSLGMLFLITILTIITIIIFMILHVLSYYYYYGHEFGQSFKGLLETYRTELMVLQ
jgi:hypothetical protein